jgi:hypothetical protein
MDFDDLVSCTSLGGINIRMLFLGFVIEVSIYIHFKIWPGTTAKNAAQGPLVGIEPTALRFEVFRLIARFARFYPQNNSYA